MDSRDALRDQIALKTADGRKLAGWGSALVFGVLVNGLLGAFVLDSASMFVTMPVLFLTAFAYTKILGQRLLPAMAMCAFSLAYLAWLVAQPPTFAEYPAAHYVAAAVCILFALQGARGALAAYRASRDDATAL